MKIVHFFLYEHSIVQLPITENLNHSPLFYSAIFVINQVFWVLGSVFILSSVLLVHLSILSNISFGLYFLSSFWESNKTQMRSHCIVLSLILFFCIVFSLPFFFCTPCIAASELYIPVC